MKLLHITASYPSYLAGFYAARPGLELRDYGAQLKTLLDDFFGVSDFLTHGLEPLGYEGRELFWNAPLQRAWVRENLPAGTELSPEDIAVAQAKQFRPDVLLFGDTNDSLLARLRAEVPSLRLVLGWTGSALPPNPEVLRRTDVVLSCAQESVDRLRTSGLASEQLHHAFDPRILERLGPLPVKTLPLTFIGQLVRRAEFHNERSRLLEQLSAGTKLVIFSESAQLGPKEDLKAAVKAGLYHVHRAGTAGGLGGVVNRIPVLKKQMGNQAAPLSQRQRALEPYLRPACYGLDMYRTLCASGVSLNIHADSSPRHASNMRLFETTGVGTCLLTDWRENLPELFRVDEEVVAYRSPEECLEKARWLLGNPAKTAEIAAAGQKRTLRDHTFERRMTELDRIIRARL